eukprot:CAMPEP_0176103828 /NCGR_PEP_ID=MMETSP0120_2-20121206/52093_1 /TAXON_ID=160619 /ORGANISM="Kryptoperidinium foliaceum, Strain CCMP 1326" /LENGTH=98 /DNA_ID=CAMNT_0017437919 /DNA_START=86 /DNA_END=379 /DNA_ORIENTATION=+
MALHRLRTDTALPATACEGDRKVPGAHRRTGLLPAPSAIVHAAVHCCEFFLKSVSAEGARATCQSNDRKSASGAGCTGTRNTTLVLAKHERSQRPLCA